MPANLRAKCVGPDPSTVVTVGDLGVFSIEQESALGVCEARRGALVQMIDATAPQARKKFLFF